MSGGDNMKTIAEKNEFIELRSKGLSYNKIAEKMKVSKPTLLKWGQEFKRHIRNREVLNQEELHQKYLISKKKRLEAFGKLMEKINKELEKRDLKDLETKDLINMFMKVSEKVAENTEVLRVRVENEKNIDEMLNYSYKDLV